MNAALEYAYEEIAQEEPQASAPRARRNAMHGQTKAVDIVLAEWGRWMRNADRVLGWQTCNVLGKVRVEGLDGAAQATSPTEIPDGIMLVDAAIAKLGQIRQKVLMAVYIEFPNDAAEVQRRRMKRKFHITISKHRWDLLLKEARYFVATELGIPATE
jgi:hypothetical protein